MARGWESKAVESQIESQESRQRPQHPSLSAEQFQRLRERESLLLSRTRVTRDLEAATNPKYRAVLEAALRHLDEKLDSLA